MNSYEDAWKELKKWCKEKNIKHKKAKYIYDSLDFLGVRMEFFRGQKSVKIPYSTLYGDYIPGLNFHQHLGLMKQLIKSGLK